VRIARLLPSFAYLGAPHPTTEQVAEGAADRHRELHFHLGGHVIHRGRRDLLGVAREADLQLEELEHQGEPEARRAPFVGHQRPVPVEQGPAGDQVFSLPLPPHGTPARSALRQR
jgi:hypothetical protein